MGRLHSFRVKPHVGAPSADGPPSSARAAPVWPLAVALLQVVVAGALLWNAEQINDVAWQLWVARQLSHGVSLYTDILEVNPPLWFWVAIPVVELAHLLGASAYHVLIVCVLALDIVALLLVRSLCRDLQSGVLIVLTFPLITLFAFFDMFEQREHLALITTIPYLVLVARRAEGLASGRTMAIACGALAAFGIALKPHFLLVPIALEIMLLLRTRRLTLRPELLALGALLIGYALSTILFASAFFAANLPMLRIYQRWGNPLTHQLSQPVAAMALLLLMSRLLYGRPRSSVAQAALVVGLAFLAAYFLQTKGWRYHEIPAMGCFALAVIAEAECFRPRAWSPRVLAAMALAALLMLNLAAPPVRAIWLNDHESAERATSDLHPGDVVAVLPGSQYWPIPEERHFIWPSRYMVYWMLMYANEASIPGKLDPETAKVIQDGLRNAAQDFACNPPRRILEARDVPGFPETGLVHFLSADPDFARLIRAYRRGPDYGDLATYDRVGQVSYRPAKCRPIY
jgi:hypothetical protein